MSNAHLDDLHLHLQPIEINSYNELEAIFSELYEAFDKAEKTVIFIRNSIGLFPEPAINQLRYAGYHIVECIASLKLSPLPIIVSRRHTTSVYKHCLRAYYDAFDVTALLVKRRFEGLVEEYRTALLSIYTEFPDAAKLKIALDDLVDIGQLEDEEFLVHMAQTKISRDEYYKKLNKKLAVVFKLWNFIPRLEDHLTVRVSQQKEVEDRKQKEREELENKEKLAREEAERKEEKEREDTEKKERLAREEAKRKEEKEHRKFILNIVVAVVIAVVTVVAGFVGVAYQQRLQDMAQQEQPKNIRSK